MKEQSWMASREDLKETTESWEEIRKRLERAQEVEASFPVHNLDLFVSPEAQQATSDVDELLTDADALLAVVPFAQHKPWCTHCDCGFEEALAVLPEHLK